MKGKDGKDSGLEIEGDVGYADVKQEFDDHSTNSSKVINDYSQEDHSQHQNKTIHDQSSRNYTTKNTNSSDSSIRDHSSHVKTENVYMGDHHNPLYYILPIVLIAVVAIGGIVLVVNQKQENLSPQVVEERRKTEKPVVPAKEETKNIEHADLGQKQTLTRGAGPAQAPSKSEQQKKTDPVVTKQPPVEKPKVVTPPPSIPQPEPNATQPVVKAEPVIVEKPQVETPPPTAPQAEPHVTQPVVKAEPVVVEKPKVVIPPPTAPQAEPQVTQPVVKEEPEVVKKTQKPKVEPDARSQSPTPVQSTPAVTILPVDDKRARQGETFKFSLLMNTVGSFCSKEGGNTGQLKQKALTDAKRQAVKMSREYVGGRFQRFALPLVQEMDIRVVELYREGNTQSGCYQVDILAETTLYKGSLSSKDERALLDDPVAPLHLRVWTDKSIYQSGDKMRVFVKGNKPFYARIIYRDASNNQVQILPNSFRPENSFQGGAIYSIPNGDDGFVLEIAPPYGQEGIEVYASTVPLGAIKKQDIGGMYLVETSRKQVAMATRGVKIKKSAPAKKKSRVVHHEQSEIAEFFEGHARLSTGKL